MSIARIIDDMNQQRRIVETINESKESRMTKPLKLEDLISLSQAATISGLSPNHLRLLVRTGAVWGIKVGRNWLTTETAVKQYLVSDRKPGSKAKHGRE